MRAIHTKTKEEGPPLCKPDPNAEGGRPKTWGPRLTDSAQEDTRRGPTDRMDRRSDSDDHTTRREGAGGAQLGPKRPHSNRTNEPSTRMDRRAARSTRTHAGLTSCAPTRRGPQYGRRGRDGLDALDPNTRAGPNTARRHSRPTQPNPPIRQCTRCLETKAPASHRYHQRGLTPIPPAP